MSRRTSKTVSYHIKDYQEIFPYDLVVFYHPTKTASEIWEVAAKDFPAVSGLVSDGIPTAAEVYRHKTAIYVAITKQATISVIAHESVHIAARVFEILNTTICPETEEIFAYITEYTFRDLVDIIKTHFKVNLKP